MSVPKGSRYTSWIRTGPFAWKVPSSNWPVAERQISDRSRRAADHARPSYVSRATPRHLRFGSRSGSATACSGMFTRMATALSVSISPNDPSSTRSAKPVIIRAAWILSVRAACPMRGITKKSAAVMTSVASEAPKESPRSSRPRPAADASRRPGARSDSTARW